LARTSMDLLRTLIAGVALTQTGCAAWFSTLLQEGQINRLRIEGVQGEPMVLILKGVPPIDSMKLPVFQSQKDGRVLKVSVSMAIGVGGTSGVRPSWPEFVFPFAIDPEISSVAYGERVLWERKDGPTASTPHGPSPERPCFPVLKLDPGKGPLAPKRP
jgi:hypothetical protein